MDGLSPEGSEVDALRYDTKMNEPLQADGQDFFKSYDEVYDTFDSMGLHENLLRGIYAYGFEKPSAIQQRGIVPFTKGLDVIQQIEKVMRALGDYLGVKVHACVDGTSVISDRKTEVVKMISDFKSSQCHKYTFKEKKRGTRKRKDVWKRRL